MTEDEQDKLIARLVYENRAIGEGLWKLQGRINALELVTGQAIEDGAKHYQDPKLYIREFVERARRRALPLADVDDPTKAERTIKERDEALEEFLTHLVAVTGG